MKDKIAGILTSVGIIAAAVLVLTGAAAVMNWLLEPKPSKDAAVATEADEQAAVDIMATYLDAFSEGDVEAMTSLICSPARLKQLNEVNGATEENFRALMQENVDNIKAEYGEDSVMRYDPESIKSKHADDYIDTLNEEFRIDRESEPIVDMARIITAEVWIEAADGTKMGRESGGLLIYRIDGVWYVYGYAS